MGDAKKIAEKHVFKNSGFGNYTEDVIGFDGYNLVTTGEISRTLTLARVDVPNIPVVFIRRNTNEK